MDEQKRGFRKETGIRHFFAAATYSLQGFQRLLAESAFRQELAAFFIGLAILAACSATAVYYLVFVVLMLALFAFEAVNTAIEELVDRVSPEISNVGKHAKDLGSMAVSCLILANVAFLGFVIVTRLLQL